MINQALNKLIASIAPAQLDLHRYPTPATAAASFPFVCLHIEAHARRETWRNHKCWSAMSNWWHNVVMKCYFLFLAIFFSGSIFSSVGASTGNQWPNHIAEAWSCAPGKLVAMGMTSPTDDCFLHESCTLKIWTLLQNYKSYNYKIYIRLLYIV